MTAAAALRQAFDGHAPSFLMRGMRLTSEGGPVYDCDQILALRAQGRLPMQPSTDTRAFDTCAEWLGTVADAAAKGETVFEGELCDGAYLVGERWPSRLAYVEHVQHLQTIEKMVGLSRLPA